MSEKPFSIIHHVGEVKKVTLADGTVVNRPDSIFVEDWGVFIPCASYDNHFVFENPDKREGTPAYLCTCGNVAVIAPPSPIGGLFVCLFDLNSGLKGLHATSAYNKKDWDKVRGQKLDMDKIRQELI